MPKTPNEGGGNGSLPGSDGDAAYALPRGRKLRLDLHSHCHEATYTTHSTVEAARAIVAAARDRGLDGLAITDHIERKWSFEVRRIVAEEYGDTFLIIPGQEAMRGYHHIVELYLAPDCVFRFMAHPTPGSGWDQQLAGLHGLEVANPHWLLDVARIKAVAQERGLLLLTNSDAHSLEAIGQYSNVLDPQELLVRARQITVASRGSQP